MKKVIAIDFDGTIVEDAYPNIGVVRDGAVGVINNLMEQGHEVIIWTCREVCEIEHSLYRYGINFTTINENTPSMMERWGNDPRKVGADVFIDDKNLESLEVDWNWIRFQLESRGILEKQKGRC